MGSRGIRCPHNKLKIRCRDCGGSAFCEHNKRKDTCKVCSSALFCEHGRRKTICRDCGGSAYCEHSKLKSRCRVCGGSAFCEHDKRRDACKVCNIEALCEHSLFKAQCRECCGSVYCEHGKQKPLCRECGGSQICIHDSRKYSCKLCNGAAFCSHGKYKTTCRECGGSAYCDHGRIKQICRECGGVAICEHDKQRTNCKECGGSAFCKHGKRKACCKECGGSALCKTPNCETFKSKHYDDYCLPCFIHLFPEKRNARNYKTKERTVVEFIQSTFTELTITNDKKVEDGCSRRRPDVLIDFGDQVLCIEVDENMHINYDCSCENKRLMELSKDIGHRPLVFLRFNPDAYINEKGKRVNSPWGLDGHGVSVIKRMPEWERRLAILKSNIEYWTENRTDKTVEVIELFYDMNIDDMDEKEIEIKDDGKAAGGAGV
jgi:hypothetical protein